MNEAEAGQLNEETPAIIEGQEGIDPPAEIVDDENVEHEIVLAGQEEPTDKPEAKNKQEYILSRVMRKKEKLQDENSQLRQQLQQQVAPQQSAQVQSAPDEYAFDDRNDYLQAYSNWQRQMLGDVVSGQLNQQQNGHRIAARQQEEEQALTAYANNASKLRVSNFNEMQDKAFDVLGDDFAKMIARELPEDGPKLMYHFGHNPKEAVRVREEYEASPGRTTFTLGKMAANLTVRKKRIDVAAPEAKIDSASVGGINEDWQSQLTKLDDNLDDSNIAKTLNARRALKARAKAAGFDVSTLN